jgi:hypothetical protein
LFAAGYWNVPGTICQRCGYGCSGGYHAPFILGPIQFDGWGSPHEVRLPSAPSPVCGCTACGDCGWQFEAASSLYGNVPVTQPTAVHPLQPTAAPATAKSTEAAAVLPTPADATPSVAPASESKQPRPIFEPPVQN